MNEIFAGMENGIKNQDENLFKNIGTRKATRTIWSAKGFRARIFTSREAAKSSFRIRIITAKKASVRSKSFLQNFMRGKRKGMLTKSFSPSPTGKFWEAASVSKMSENLRKNLTKANL